MNVRQTFHIEDNPANAWKKLSKYGKGFIILVVFLVVCSRIPVPSQKDKISIVQPVKSQQDNKQPSPTLEPSPTPTATPTDVPVPSATPTLVPSPTPTTFFQPLHQYNDGQTTDLNQPRNRGKKNKRD